MDAFTAALLVDHPTNTHDFLATKKNIEQILTNCSEKAVPASSTSNDGSLSAFHKIRARRNDSGILDLSFL